MLLNPPILFYFFIVAPRKILNDVCGLRSVSPGQLYTRSFSVRMCFKLNLSTALVYMDFLGIFPFCTEDYL